MLEQKTLEYAEEELNPMFSSLISLVGIGEKETDLTDFDAGKFPSRPMIPPGKFESVANEFNTTWKGAINRINSSVIQSFPNFQNGYHYLLMN